IVGAGPYEPALRARAERLGVANRVDIGELPAGDRKGMADLLARSGLLVLLSEYESQSITLMEALSAGCPVLASASTALREPAQKGWFQAVPMRSTSTDVATAIVDPL